MLDIGTEVIYLPINWVNNQAKTDNPLYGKKAKIVSFKQSNKDVEPVYFIRVQGEARVMYAYIKELEVI